MGEEIGHLATAEIQVGAPVPILLRIPIAPLQRSQEMRPIQVRRALFEAIRRLAQVVVVAVPPGACQRDLAQLAGIHVHLLGFQVVLAGALLHAHLADAAVDARGLDDGRPFLHLEGQRLFHVHVLARVERIDGNGGMPVVRHADQHGVQLLHLEQFAMVAEGLGFRRDPLCGIDLGAVDIADGRDIHGSGLDELAHVAAAALAATDEAELHALVGAVDTGVGKCSGGSHAAEECPS